MFYVNDEPEGKFLYTETIKLYCSLYCIVLTSSRVLLELLECVALFLDLDGLHWQHPILVQTPLEKWGEH